MHGTFGLFYLVETMLKISHEKCNTFKYMSGMNVEAGSQSHWEHSDHTYTYIHTHLSCNKQCIVLQMLKWTSPFLLSTTVMG